MERPVRVLVADPLKLMREALIDAFADQPDIEVVGEVSEEGDVPARVRETRPDFVFIGSDDPGVRPALCDTVLRHHPEANVIAIGAHSNKCVRYWVSSVIQSTVMEASEAAILAAVRKRTVLEGEASCDEHVN